MKVRELDFGTDWEWVSRVISPILCADTCGIVAVEGNEIVSAAVYDSFTVSSANVHLGISKPIVIRRGFLFFVADYIFNYRGRKRIFGLTPENNSRAVRFNEHIGMQKVGHIADAYDDGVGYIVTRMDKEDCRWLQEPPKGLEDGR